MKTYIFLMVWYFAMGQEFFTFNEKAACDRLNKYHKDRGVMVSDCDYNPWDPRTNKIEQRTSGANSPAIVGGKGGVTINNGKVEKK